MISVKLRMRFCWRVLALQGMLSSSCLDLHNIHCLEIMVTWASCQPFFYPFLFTKFFVSNKIKQCCYIFILYVFLLCYMSVALVFCIFVWVLILWSGVSFYHQRRKGKTRSPYWWESLGVVKLKMSWLNLNGHLDWLVY